MGIAHGRSCAISGPVASALKAKVPDLTVLAKNNRGVFPAADVHRIEWDQDLGQQLALLPFNRLRTQTS
jgi:hypothetical protein